MASVKTGTARRTDVSTKKKIIFSLAITSAFAILVYMGSIGLRTFRLYRFVKDGQRGWKGRALAPDPTLGFAPIPGSSGLELVPNGPGLPVRFDNDGLRIPLDPPKDPTTGSPSLLALGCSFTYGEACVAEDTYPYALARLTRSRCRNAGVTSYGLTQMLILARRLIPKYRPDYVVVQYSPWLVDRAQSFYAHIAFGTTPVPFFVDSPGGELRIHPPVFVSKAAALSVDEYRSRPASFGDCLSFLVTIGGPLVLHDDYRMGIHRLKRLTGFTPPPAANRQKIIDSAYREISDLCRDYQAKMIILVLGWNQSPVDHHQLDQIPGVVVVDPQPTLVSKLPERTTLAYQRMYGHWGGNPPVCFDDHPNPTAHLLIAQEPRQGH